MKKGSFIFLLALPFLQSFRCGKSNDYFNPENPTVMLATVLNNTSETIHLGDTLTFKLIVSDTLNLISKINNTIDKVSVSSLQTCFYNFTFYSIDTTGSRSVTRITDISSAFVTNGTIISSIGTVYTTTTNKPYLSTLNIVAKTKGLFYVEFGNQETTVKANNSTSAGLRVNIDAANKHWYLFDPYNPGFSSAMPQRDNEGYGWYLFRVN